MKKESGHLTVGDLPSVMAKIKALNEMLTEDEISTMLGESYPDRSQDVDFESFLRVSADTDEH